MKKRKLTGLMLIVVAAMTVLLLWPAKESTGVFYRISGGKNELYILGSIHIGSREMYPVSRSVSRAIREADAMVFECDTQSAQAAAQTAALMNYAPDDSLEKHIGAETLKKLQQVSEKLDYDFEMLKRYKPWAITSMLSMETLAVQMGTKDVKKASELGVDTQVRRMAQGKEKVYLETVQEQLGRMDAFSPALQEYLLDDACRMILQPEQAADEDLRSWPEWWTAGNAEAFAQSYLRSLKAEEKPELAKEYHDSLVSQRNLSMADTLCELLESDRFMNCFATIGLMHLVLEEDSVLTHLQNRGYIVEKIEN